MYYSATTFAVFSFHLHDFFFDTFPFKLLAAFIKLNTDQDVMSQEVNVML